MESLSQQIIEALEEYSEELDEEMGGVIDEVAAKTVQKLKSNAAIPKKRGKYKKSFYSKIIAKGRGYKRVAIANREYGLGHLLEKGHLTKSGTTRTKAYPHWKDAAEFAEKELERLIDEL